jgi:acetylornithine deacetylase/succinyl-diaminopimelate desuccinylase-like protein
VRDLARTGRRPNRPLTVVFFADEEAGGVFGSQWIVERHPSWFEGVTEAISEVGGYSVTVPRSDGTDARVYLLQTAEKGIAWLRLVATGRAGHGSLVNPTRMPSPAWLPRCPGLPRTNGLASSSPRCVNSSTVWRS